MHLFLHNFVQIIINPLQQESLQNTILDPKFKYHGDLLLYKFILCWCNFAYTNHRQSYNSDPLVYIYGTVIAVFKCAWVDSPFLLAISLK